MRKLTLNNIDDFIVISDVHLRDPKDKLTEIFIKTLEDILDSRTHPKKKPDAIFLLGDIFDFIGISKQFFYDLWQNVFSTFKKLKKSGISVYFIEGNHDFGFEHFPSQQLEEHFTAYGDFYVEMEHKKIGLIVLSHGDQIICSPSYLKFRALVKAKFFQKITHFLFPGVFLKFILSRYAKISRSKDQYRTLPRSFLEDCLKQYLEDRFKEDKRKINTLILGHIHILLDEYINETHILVGPDWLSAPSYLRCSESGEFIREFPITAT